MKYQADNDMYKGLASYFLPDGILEYFDVVDFAEETTPENNLYHKILHLYLDERDNRPTAMSETKSNGFTEERCILDFPIRDRKTILHVRHRRWITPEGHNYIVSLESITHDKTQYSKEFAFFLKGGGWTMSL